jgi:ABC-type amino acid transport substrate-binding protein
MIVATEGAFAPFNYYEGTKLTGFEVDIAEAIVKQLGLKMEWKVVPFDAQIASLGQDRFDFAIASHGYTEERAKAVDFTEPHYCTGGQIAARKDGHDGRWFRASDEASVDAFLRRLRADDPAREVFERYAEELKARWASAKVVPNDAVEALLNTKAQKYAAETREFEAAVLGQVDAMQSDVKEATGLTEKKNKEGVLAVVDTEKGERVEGEERLQEAKEMFETEKEKIAQVLNSLKIGK